MTSAAWDGSVDPTGWWMGEWLEGVRAWWDGKKFSTANRQINAPSPYRQMMPDFELDGVLVVDCRNEPGWKPGDSEDETRAIIYNSNSKNVDAWKRVKYLVYDRPNYPRGFRDRIRFLREFWQYHVDAGFWIPWEPLKRDICHSRDHLIWHFDYIRSIGSKGLMLWHSNGRYVAGSSDLKMRVCDLEAKEAVVSGRSGDTDGIQGLIIRNMDGTWLDLTLTLNLGEIPPERVPPVGSRIIYRIHMVRKTVVHIETLT